MKKSREARLMSGLKRYAIEIFYSGEDRGFIAIAPELPGCSAFGKTEEEALREIKAAIDLWLETAEKEGRQIPRLFLRGPGFTMGYNGNEHPECLEARLR